MSAVFPFLDFFEVAVDIGYKRKPCLADASKLEVDVHAIQGALDWLGAVMIVELVAFFVLFSYVRPREYSLSARAWICLRRT
jgi:hypothetical protein